MFKLALGAGHYYGTAGKRIPAYLDPNETREWVLNDRVCDLIELALEDYEGCELLRLDDSDDGQTDVTLQTRAQAANKWGADFYLSIHHNAGIGGGTGGGIVAYSHPSGSQASHQWRDELYETLIEHTGLRGNRANPKTTSNLYELRATAMPAVLLELGFMDSKTDAPVILTAEYARECARAIVETIVRKAGLTKKTAKPTGTEAAAPAEPVPSGLCISVETVKSGSKGDAVKALQILLNGFGHKCGTADGIFGTKTGTALKAFQKANGLTQDGIAGKATWTALLN